MRFDLNCKKFSGKFLNDIKTGIQSKYLEKYENIEITYRMIKHKYTFFIYSCMPILKNNNWEYDQKILLTQYSNLEAIEHFISISKDEFFDKYDDSRHNYLEKFKEEIEALLTMYITLGMNLKLEQNRYGEYIVTYNKGNSSGIYLELFGKKYITMRTKYEDVLTKEEYINNLKSLRNTLRDFYEKK